MQKVAETINHTNATYTSDVALINNATSQVKKWYNFKEYFTSVFSEDSFQLWFSNILLLKESDDTIILQCDGRFTCDWIKDHYSGILECYARKIATSLCFVFFDKITDKLSGIKIHQAEGASWTTRLSDKELIKIASL